MVLIILINRFYQWIEPPWKYIKMSTFMRAPESDCLRIYDCVRISVYVPHVTNKVFFVKR